MRKVGCWLAVEFKTKTSILVSTINYHPPLVMNAYDLVEILRQSAQGAYVPKQTDQLQS